MKHIFVFYISDINLVLKKNLIIFLFHASYLCFSQQGNYKFNNFGNRSILLTGNVTGSVSDLGLTYYNPSFLAKAENVGFSLNAKAYQLVDVKLENVLNENSKLNSSRFNGASTMAGGIFNLFGTRFAYSYLTKSNFNLNLNYSSYYLNNNILSIFPDAEKHNANIGLNSRTKDDWTGLTWAYALTDKFSLGITTFASIYNYNGGSDLSHTIVSTGNNVAFYQNTISFRQKSYGLFIKIGANYEFENIDLGLNISLPYIEVYSHGTYSYIQVVAGIDSTNNNLVDNYFDNVNSTRKEPLGISLGAGIPVNKSKIHINVDYYNGLNEYKRLEIPDIDTGDSNLTTVNFNEERRSVLNFGAGIEFYLSEYFKAYGGFSTDYSAFRSSANVFNLSSSDNKEINIGSNFFHMSLGVDWKLNWSSIVAGVTYSSSSGSFADPYRIDIDGFGIENNLTAKLKYTRWQFVIGIDIPILNKKVNDILKKEPE